MIPDDLVGSSIGPVQVLERVGKGGMGWVYRGHDTLTNMPVAIKRLAPTLRLDPESRARVIEEARTTAPFVKHPNIVAVLHVEDRTDELFLIMEWIDGPTLRQKIEQRVSVEESLDIITQSAKALADAHRRGIVHRDIKPENIMLTNAGVVRVCDFGMASKVVEVGEGTTVDDATWAASFGGTPGYMAPEILRGETASPQSDIFSLGIVFYELLTGTNPFRAGAWNEIVHRTFQHYPERLAVVSPGVKPTLDRVVFKMLEKDSSRRYSDGAELVEDLVSLRARPARKGYWATLVTTTVLSTFLMLNPFASPLHTEAHLVVLPFRVAGGADAALADGLTEVVTSRLGDVKSGSRLQVVSAAEIRSSAIGTPSEARKQFGATLVLAGVFQTSGNSVRVSYSLVDARTLTDLDSGVETGSLKDLFQLQDQLTGSVLRKLQIQVDAPGAERSGRQETANPLAELAYTRGRGFIQNYTQMENIDRSIAAFDQAIEAESGFALAYAGLGEARLRKFHLNRQPEWLEKARSACDQAAKLGPRLSMSHLCIGMVDSEMGEYESARQELELALKLDPENLEAIKALGRAQEKAGDLESAEQTYVRVIRARPHHWDGFGLLGAFYNRNNRHAEGVQQLRYASALSPDNGQLLVALGAALLRSGQVRQAIPVLERAVLLRPHFDSFSNLGMCYFVLKQYNDAAANLEKAVALGEDFRVTGNLARTYRILGQTRKAREFYERAIREGNREVMLNSRNSDAHILLARYHSMIGDKPEMLSHLAIALGARPNDSHYLEIAAGAYNQVGEKSRAIATIQRALELGLAPSRLNSEIELAGLGEEPGLKSIARNR